MRSTRAALRLKGHELEGVLRKRHRRAGLALLIGVVVYVFCEPFRDRIRYLRRARLPGSTELEFGERVGEAEVTFHLVV